MREIQQTLNFDYPDPRPLIFRAGENNVRVHFKTEQLFDSVYVDKVVDTDGVPEAGGFYIDIPSTMTKRDESYIMVISYNSTRLIYPFRVSVERSI